MTIRSQVTIRPHVNLLISSAIKNSSDDHKTVLNFGSLCASFFGLVLFITSLVLHPFTSYSRVVQGHISSPLFIMMGPNSFICLWSVSIPLCYFSRRKYFFKCYGYIVRRVLELGTEVPTTYQFESSYKVLSKTLYHNEVKWSLDEFQLNIVVFRLNLVLYFYNYYKKKIKLKIQIYANFCQKLWDSI